MLRNFFGAVYSFHELYSWVSVTHYELTDAATDGRARFFIDQ